MPYESYSTYQTRQALARQRAEREQWEEQQKEEQAARVQENAAARKRHLDGLAREKAEADRRREAETDAALAPAKARATRDWLLSNPGKDAAAFEREAWPLVRANLIEDQRAAVFEATKAQLRNSGMYDF